MKREKSGNFFWDPLQLSRVVVIVVKAGDDLSGLQGVLIGSGTMDYPVGNHYISDILTHV